MFLKKLINKNQELIRTAVELHSNGEIPPNSFVFDLDAVKFNARLLAEEAKKCNLKMYLMTKQFNRNPFVSAVALSECFEGIVAVDFQCASINNRFGIPVKHMGHLNQVPNHDVIKALNYNPEVITVFSDVEAKRISEVASINGRKQDILLRIVGKNDTFFYGQEGGILETEIEKTVRSFKKLKNINIAGVTSFPCLNYIFKEGQAVEPTNNLKTIVSVADFLRSKLDIDIKQINAPGNNFLEVFKILSDYGATHIEPGHGLLGSTASHAYDDLKGFPTFLYVSEISHLINGKGYAFGGGLTYGKLMDGNMEKALVGSSFDKCINNIADIETESRDGQKQLIDYHQIIIQGGRCNIGDTVISGFYSQMQMTRSYIVPVSGIHSNKTRIEAIFDNGCHPIDRDYKYIEMDLILERLKKLKEQYSFKDYKNKLYEK